MSAILPLQWAEAFKEEGVELCHAAPVSLLADSLLCYFTGLSSPTCPLSFGVFIALQSPGGFLSDVNGGGDGWNKRRSSSESRRLLRYQTGSPPTTQPPSFTFPSGNVQTLCVLPSCPFLLLPWWQPRAANPFTLHRMPGGDSGGQ